MLRFVRHVAPPGVRDVPSLSPGAKVMVVLSCALLAEDFFPLAATGFEFVLHGKELAAVVAQLSPHRGELFQVVDPSGGHAPGLAELFTGSRDALDSFVAFRGRKPQLDALLRQAGITPAQ